MRVICPNLNHRSNSKSGARVPAAWSAEAEAPFERFYESLDEYEQAVLTAAVEFVLEVHGNDICHGEWGTPLGQGLYEFRIRKSLSSIYATAKVTRTSTAGDDKKVLLRVFCTFQGDKVILLFSGYNKSSDPSEKRQAREIKRARKMLTAWKEKQKKSKSKRPKS